jgi:tetratricopeptide (TPR) repeat protein
MYIISYYMWRPFYPVDLSPVYYNLYHFNPLSTPFILSAFAFIAVSVTLFIFRKRWPLLIALWLAYIILLFPFMGFSEHPHFHSDRYSLLPSICLSILIAFGLINLMKNKYLSVISVAVLIMLICILSPMSANQIKIWRNSETLFSYVIKTLGDNPYRQDIYYRLGVYLYEKGKKEEAISNYAKALAINPYNPDANARMAEIEYQNNHIEKSIVHLQNVIVTEPDNVSVHYWLSKLFNKLNKKKEAAYHFERAANLQQSNSNAKIAPQQSNPD